MRKSIKHDPEEYAKLEVKPSHNFFFLNGELHKSLYETPAIDKVYTWNFKTHEEVAYPLSDVRKNKEPAWSLQMAALIINRHVKTVRKVLWKNTVIEPPQYSYATPGHPGKRKTGHWLSNEDIHALRDHFASKVMGGSPKSRMHVNNTVPSREEVRAKLTDSRVVYVKENGVFVPIWRA